MDRGLGGLGTKTVLVDDEELGTFQRHSIFRFWRGNDLQILMQLMLLMLLISLMSLMQLCSRKNPAEMLYQFLKCIYLKCLLSFVLPSQSRAFLSVFGWVSPVSPMHLSENVLCLLSVGTAAFCCSKFDVLK